MLELTTQHALQDKNSEPKYKMADESVSLDAKTTVKDLNQIITEPAHGFFMLPSDPYNEVFDGIFVGDA